MFNAMILTNATTHPLRLLLCLSVVVFSSTAWAVEAPVAKEAEATKAPTAEPVVPADPEENLRPDTKEKLAAASQAIHQEARAVGNELRDDEEIALPDIAMLFQAAVERSDAIRYAINKLSRRDATGEPVQQDGFVKKTARSLARLAGTGSSMILGNPAGMVGAGVVEDLLTSNDPYQRQVTDADMVLLAREVDKLQWAVIEKYYNYRYSFERWELSKDAKTTLDRYYDSVAKSGDTTYGQYGGTEATTMNTIMSSLYESAVQDEQQTRQEYVSARNALGLLVGPDALLALKQASQASESKNEERASSEADEATAETAADEKE